MCSLTENEVKNYVDIQKSKTFKKYFQQNCIMFFIIYIVYLHSNILAVEL